MYCVTAWFFLSFFFLTIQRLGSEFCYILLLVNSADGDWSWTREGEEEFKVVVVADDDFDNDKGADDVTVAAAAATTTPD